MKYLQVRLGDDLYSRLKAAADRDHRSLNGEVIVALERFLADAEREQRARGE
jgi:hypothetical protein